VQWQCTLNVYATISIFNSKIAMVSWCLSQTNQRRAQRVPAVPGIVRDKQERSELDPSEPALATFTPARIIN